LTGAAVTDYRSIRVSSLGLETSQLVGMICQFIGVPWQPADVHSRRACETLLLRSWCQFTMMAAFCGVPFNA
jgi:hypothetical protein